MQQNDNFRLVVRRGPQPNQAFEISKDLTTLGRDITNDIVLNDRETSRHHLRLMRSGDTMTIEDLGSTNGTFVNGKRVSGVTPAAKRRYDRLGRNGDTGPGSLQQPGRGRAAQRARHADACARRHATGRPGANAPRRARPITPPTERLRPAQPGRARRSLTRRPPPTPIRSSRRPIPATPISSRPAPTKAAPAGYGAPPAPPGQYPGYDYDPYAVREESGGTSPWLILGCFVFFVLVFVCFAGIALTVIDVLNLWCEVPVIVDVVIALNLGC